MFNATKFNIFNATLKTTESFAPFINFHSFRLNVPVLSSSFSAFSNFRSFTNNLSSDSILLIKYSDFISKKTGTFIGKLRFNDQNRQAQSLFERLREGLHSTTVETKPGLYTHL
jgi:hypothetical protein